MEEKDIQFLLDRLPKNILLTRWGNYIKVKEKDETDFNFDLENINFCIRYIKFFYKKTKNINYNRTSYGYKHDMEDVRKLMYPNKNSYISNGEFIIACMWIGYKFKFKNDCINANFNIKLDNDFYNKYCKIYEEKNKDIIPI